MKIKPKFIILYYSLILIGFLIVNTGLNSQSFRLFDNLKEEEITSIKPSQGTVTMYEWTPYGSISASSPIPDPDEQDYFEWSISTLYGPGFSWYMMNNTDFLALITLQNEWRTRGNFSYTALLSDEEESASGTFYPSYLDTWWFVTINHYTGINCSVAHTDDWLDDFITVDEPTNSNSWADDMSHYINWTWGGDFAYVDIDLYYDGDLLSNIATNTQNNGSYLWEIPVETFLFNDLYQVNISNSEFNATWGMSDAYFEIVEKKSILVTTPSATDSWKKGTAQEIKWNSTGIIENVDIELFKNGVFEMELASNEINTGSLIPSWAIPSDLEDSTQYQIKITDSSDPSIYDFSDYFEIYTPIPDIPGYDVIIVLGISIASIIGLSWKLILKRDERINS